MPHQETVNGETPEQSPAPRPTGKREQNARAIRKKILGASRQLFSTIGYQDATITKIREVAAVSIATFYKYFDSKQAVLLALVEEEHAEHEAAVADALKAPVGDIPDYLVAIVLAVLDTPAEGQQLALWREIIAASVLLSSTPAGVASMSTDRDFYTGHMAKAFEILRLNKLIRDDIPKEAIADVLYCVSSHEFQDYVCGRYADAADFHKQLRKEIGVVISPWLAAKER